MRILLVMLLLAGCQLNVPIDQHGLSEDMCKEGKAEFQGVTYTLHLTDDTDELYKWCGVDKYGNPAEACIKGSDIYAPRRCLAHLAHELDHLLGNHWVDIPRIREY